VFKSVLQFMPTTPVSNVCVCVCKALYIFKNLRLTVLFRAVTFCTTELNIQIFYILPRDCIYLFMCLILHVSQYKQRLLP